MRDEISKPVFGLSSKLWAVAVILWGCAALGVWAWFTGYACRAEPLRARECVAWPSKSLLPIVPQQQSLLIFLHPRCPCSVATMHELERVLSSSNSARTNVILVATLPVNLKAASPSTNSSLHDWTDSETMALASRFPGAAIYWDFGGLEAQRFGATTSGTVMFFDSQGNLRFAGGVTIARGHQGSSVGSDCLKELLSPRSQASQSSQAVFQAAPVFGCRLCLDAKTVISDTLRSSSDSVLQSDVQRSSHAKLVSTDKSSPEGAQP